MEYFFFSRFFLVLAAIINHLTYLALIIIFINFNLDSSIYNLDSFALTRLSKNFNFSLCSVVECKSTPYYSMGLNLMICFVLFFQEIIFANKDIRAIFVTRATSDLIYYPKHLSKIICSFSILMSSMLYQPMNYIDTTVYWKIDWSDYIRRVWFIIPFLIGVYQITMSLKHHYVTNDELGGMIMMKCILNRDIPYPAEYTYGDGIFHKMRSPFRGGVLFLMFSMNTKWDIGRWIYFGMFAFSMLIECVNEDKYYYVKFDTYKTYVKLVRWRFFNVDMFYGNNRVKANTVNNSNGNSKSNSNAGERKKEEGDGDKGGVKESVAREGERGKDKKE